MDKSFFGIKVKSYAMGIALILSVFALTFAACNIDGTGDGDAVSPQLSQSIGALPSRSAGTIPTEITSWNAIPDYDRYGGGGYVTYGAGLFLAAHWTDGGVSLSPDGVTWASITGTVTTFGNNYIKYIAYLNGKFWAVGQGGKIATSNNGLSWTSVQQNETNADIYGIAYGVIDGVGTYVFVTDTNDTTTYRSQIVYSTDGGANWDAIAILNNPVPTLKIDSIVYANGNFALFSNTGYISYTSGDIDSWVTAFQVDTGTGINSNHFKMAAVGNNTIIATSRYGYAYASTSNLAAWSWKEVYPSSVYSTHVWFNCVVFDGTRFIMAGEDGAMAWTVNGASFTADTNFDNPSLSWTKGLYAGDLYINGIAFNGTNRYVASGGDTKPTGAYTTGF